MLHFTMLEKRIVFDIGQRFWRCDYGCLHSLYISIIFDDLKARDEIQNRAALLIRDNLTSGKRPTVTHPLHFEQHWTVLVAATNEVGVQRVGSVSGRYRPSGGA